MVKRQRVAIARLASSAARLVQVIDTPPVHLAPEVAEANRALAEFHKVFPPKHTKGAPQIHE